MKTRAIDSLVFNLKSISYGSLSWVLLLLHRITCRIFICNLLFTISFLNITNFKNLLFVISQIHGKKVLEPINCVTTTLRNIDNQEALKILRYAGNLSSQTLLIKRNSGKKQYSGDNVAWKIHIKAAKNYGTSGLSSRASQRQQATCKCRVWSW